MNFGRLNPKIIVLGGVLLLGGALSLSFGYAKTAGNSASLEVPVARPGLAPGVQLPNMAAIVEQNGAAVVNISVVGGRKMAGDQGLPQLDPADPFYEFFRHFGVPQFRGEAPVRGQGSGFIVTSDGTVLTNAHVVDGADEVTVKLTDKREFKAKVRGFDKASDVAVLKIDAKGLPIVRIGSSSATRVGEWVLAIGSPFGFENSATAGIVSAKSRTLPDGSYVPFLQTDVAVNPGNSGGPLFNMAGEVIGINSQIYSRSGGYQGLSFAIPIELAMNVEKQIVAHGKVQRGRLGISIQDVDQSLADTFGLLKPAGALVAAVEKGGPADQAGLQPGDVILGVNGKDIVASNELPAVVAAMHSGETASLQIWRKGKRQEIAVKIGNFDAAPRAEATDDAGKGRLGIAARSLTAEEKRQVGVAGGVVVEESRGAARRAGIRAGDIILSVNGEAVSNPEQLRQQLAKAGKRAALLVERGDSRLFIPVELG